MHGSADLLKRAKRIYQTEGLVSLSKRVAAFAVGLFFQYQTYYLLERALEYARNLNEADFLPRIDRFDLKVIATNQGADELEAEGYEFRSYRINTREALDKGAIAFCIYVGRELVHIGWVAMTEEAMEILNEPPYKVDFLNNEACTTAAWTNPRYRRMGVREYIAMKKHRYMLEHGIRTSRIAIAKNNLAFYTGSARSKSRAYAEARYLKILWWKSLKERPLTPQQQKKLAKQDV